MPHSAAPGRRAEKRRCRKDKSARRAGPREVYWSVSYPSFFFSWPEKTEAPQGRPPSPAVFHFSKILPHRRIRVPRLQIYQNLLFPSPILPYFSGIGGRKSLFRPFSASQAPLRQGGQHGRRHFGRRVELIRLHVMEQRRQQLSGLRPVVQSAGKIGPA